MATGLVTYVGMKGHQKPAMVIVDSETFVEGSELEAPLPGHAHLLVFSLTEIAPRANVPTKEVAETIDDYKVDGELRGYYF